MSIIFQINLLSLLFVDLFIFLIIVHTLYHITLTVEINQSPPISLFIENQLKLIIVKRIFRDTILISGGIVQWWWKDRI
jgi:hypothetical protein